MTRNDFNNYPFFLPAINSNDYQFFPAINSNDYQFLPAINNNDYQFLLKIASDSDAATNDNLEVASGSDAGAIEFLEVSTSTDSDIKSINDNNYTMSDLVVWFIALFLLIVAYLSKITIRKMFINLKGGSKND